MNQDFDKNKKSNGNTLNAILIREVDNISNFNEDIQPDNIEEQIEIPQMEIEEKQIDYNFVNNINLNNEEFQKDKIQDSYQNLIHLIIQIISFMFMKEILLIIILIIALTFIKNILILYFLN